ncbi:MAG: dihydroorotate dehydrogenase electron transfer subunit, partial [Oscillospiraceae bacterium]|nr:dihydroorotate dehydrogenase electron transfer subunit [Oscillospiraceae bacterium]
MNQCKMFIMDNEPIANGTMIMTLEGAFDPPKPGQFINIQLPGLYLRRPFSVCDATEKRLIIIYKLVGKGTELMSNLTEYTRLDVLCGLGNGFDLTKCGERPVLVGGGAGVAPLYLLAKKLLLEGKKPSVFLGFNDQEDMFLVKEFR